MCKFWSMKEREEEWLQYYVILAPTLMCCGLEENLSRSRHTAVLVK